MYRSVTENVRFRPAADEQEKTLRILFFRVIFWENLLEIRLFLLYNYNRQRLDLPGGPLVQNSRPVQKIFLNGGLQNE